MKINDRRNGLFALLDGPRLPRAGGGGLDRREFRRERRPRKGEGGGERGRAPRRCVGWFAGPAPWEPDRELSFLWIALGCRVRPLHQVIMNQHVEDVRLLRLSFLLESQSRGHGRSRGPEGSRLETPVPTPHGEPGAQLHFGVFPEGEQRGRVRRACGEGGGIHGVRGCLERLSGPGTWLSPRSLPPRAPLAPCFHPPETLNHQVSSTTHKSKLGFGHESPPTGV